LVPDAPIALPDEPRVTRLREIVRNGLLVLTSGDTPTGTGRDVIPAPLRVLAIPDIDHTGLLAEALDAQPGQTWIIRPDGHVAAIVPKDDADGMHKAVRRALGGVPD
jgi:pentachlorophenol monooxygenase/3-(3-hydroxy-phenyl)propionate hydroxylase